MKPVIRRFESPDDARSFPKGRLELLTLSGVTVGRATYEPGWKWSEHVGAATGAKSCQVEHVVLVVSGRNAVRMDDGTEFMLVPGDLAYIPPGHDSWVVGDEPYVSLHFVGATQYASSG